MKAEKTSVILITDGENITGVVAKDPKTRKNIIFSCVEQTDTDIMNLLNKGQRAKGIKLPDEGGVVDMSVLE